MQIGRDVRWLLHAAADREVPAASTSPDS